MPVRLVITTYAKPGKGAELAQAMADRCRAVQQEPGCQQFEVFQSALAPDKLVTLELWADQAALDAHAQRNATRPPHPALAALRADGIRPREDRSYWIPGSCAPSTVREAQHLFKAIEKEGLQGGNGDNNWVV